MQYGKLTAGHNVLWESSRMMLPEHREAFVAQRNRWGDARRPDPDEQATAIWLECLELSWRNHVRIRVTTWGFHHEEVRTGYVRAVDFERQRVQMELEDAASTGEHRVWLRWEDVTGLEHLGD